MTADMSGAVRWKIDTFLPVSGLQSQGGSESGWSVTVCLALPPGPPRGVLYGELERVMHAHWLIRLATTQN